MDNTNNNTTKVAEALRAEGFQASEWEKYGKHRVYINYDPQVKLWFDIDPSADLGDNPINNEAVILRAWSEFGGPHKARQVEDEFSMALHHGLNRELASY